MTMVAKMQRGETFPVNFQKLSNGTLAQEFWEISEIAVDVL